MIVHAWTHLPEDELGTFPSLQIFDCAILECHFAPIAVVGGMGDRWVVPTLPPRMQSLEPHAKRARLRTASGESDQKAASHADAQRPSEVLRHCAHRAVPQAQHGARGRPADTRQDTRGAVTTVAGGDRGEAPPDSVLVLAPAGVASAPPSAANRARLVGRGSVSSAVRASAPQFVSDRRPSSLQH